MRVVRAVAYAAVTALLVGAIGAGIATGHKKKIKSTVTIEFTDTVYGDSFSGEVNSKKRKCERNRKVTVFRGGTSVGSDTTNNQGEYVVPVDNAAPGNYFAKAKKKVLKKNKKHKHVCRKAKSPTITVP
jgi:hypothetical protein